MKGFIHFIFFVILLGFPCLAQETTVLTNADIIQMVKVGLSQEIIRAKIETSRCSFDTSVTALAQLRDAAVPDAVVLMLVKAKCQKPGNTVPVAENKKDKETIPLQQREYEYTTLTDLDAFPEKFENKIVFFRAKLEDVRRVEEGLFAVGLSSGSISVYSNTYKYVASVFGRSSLNVIALGRTAEILLKNVSSNPCLGDCLFGGIASNMGENRKSIWVVNLFDIDNFSVSPTASLIGRIKSSMFTSESEIQYLVNNGGDINFTENNGLTPLMLAAKGKSKSATKALIKLRAKLDQTDNAGRTALMHAVTSSSEDICEMLLRAGAKADLKDTDGKTAFDFSTKLDNKGIGKLLQS